MINELGKKALEIAIKNGFPPNPNGDITRALLLMHTEISEAVEADRMNRYADPSLNIMEAVQNLNDVDYVKWYEANIKHNYEEEMADLTIRAFQHATVKNVNLEDHIHAKMRYNGLREYKHGGKKY